RLFYSERLSLRVERNLAAPAKTEDDNCTVLWSVATDRIGNQQSSVRGFGRNVPGRIVPVANPKMPRVQPYNKGGGDQYQNVGTAAFPPQSDQGKRDRAQQKYHARSWVVIPFHVLRKEQCYGNKKKHYTDRNDSARTPL